MDEDESSRPEESDPSCSGKPQDENHEKGKKASVS